MYRVLIVDDNHFSRKMLSRALSAGGYEVMEAVNGLRASEMVKTEQPDALVTDLVMPEMSGVELLQFLQQHALSLPS